MVLLSLLLMKQLGRSYSNFMALKFQVLQNVLNLIGQVMEQANNFKWEFQVKKPRKLCKNTLYLLTNLIEMWMIKFCLIFLSKNTLQLYQQKLWLIHLLEFLNAMASLNFIRMKKVFKL